MLELVNVSINHASKPLFWPVSERIGDREILAIMGPSGIGKSCLLAYMAGTLSTDLTGEGDVVLNGKALNTLPSEKRELGLLQQAPLLFPHMTVEENLLFALRPTKSRKERHQIVWQHLQQVGLDRTKHQLPQQLSGGQQARLALIRTLLSAPKALLLDEPFSKLDKALKSEIRELVLSAVKTANIPAILVTHDEDDTAHLADRTIALQPYQGRFHS